MTHEDREHGRNQGDVETRSEYNKVLKAVLRIARLWQLSDDELATLLAGLSAARVRRWRDRLDASKALLDADVTPDMIYRMSCLLGIYKNLQILLPNPLQADGWVRRANNAPGFGGRSALEVMLRGRVDDLIFVRRYLDSECQN